MKKLILILAMITLSLSSMAMGFPQNSHIQQRELMQNHKSISQKSLKTLEMQLTANFEKDKIEEEIKGKSLIEMVANFFVEIFCKEMISKKVIAVEKDEVNCYEYNFLAVKKEFDYSLIG